MNLIIPVYLAAIALAALAVGWAASLARKSGERPYRVYFYFVIVNVLVGLTGILFRYLPARIDSSAAGLGSTMAGFLIFPLMAAFSFLVVDLQLSVADREFPKLLKQIYAGYWGLLFIGFLAAEFRWMAHKDMRLTDLLMPFFDAAIVVSGLGSALYVFIMARSSPDQRDRRFIRLLSGYFIASFLVFGILYFGIIRFGSGRNTLAHSLFGFAYLLPPLIWLGGRLKETRTASLTRVAGAGDVLDRWLEANGLSPREGQIVARVLQGKTNKAIEQELFIGRRTVESHLYSIYRKLGVKNRLQLARLAAAETERDRV